MAMLTVYKTSYGSGSEAKPVFFLGKPSIYANIGVAAGVTEAATNELDSPITPVGNLLATPHFVGLVAITSATEGGKVKKHRHQVIVQASKFSSFKDNVTGDNKKQILGRDCIDVTTAQRDTFK